MSRSFKHEGYRDKYETSQAAHLNQMIRDIEFNEEIRSLEEDIDREYEEWAEEGYNYYHPADV